MSKLTYESLFLINRKQNTDLIKLKSQLRKSKRISSEDSSKIDILEKQNKKLQDSICDLSEEIVQQDKKLDTLELQNSLSVINAINGQNQETKEYNAINKQNVKLNEDLQESLDAFDGIKRNQLELQYILELRDHEICELTQKKEELEYSIQERCESNGSKLHKENRLNINRISQQKIALHKAQQKLGISELQNKKLLEANQKLQETNQKLIEEINDVPTPYCWVPYMQHFFVKLGSVDEGDSISTYVTLALKDTPGYIDFLSDHVAIPITNRDHLTTTLFRTENGDPLTIYLTHKPQPLEQYVVADIDADAKTIIMPIGAWYYEIDSTVKELEREICVSMPSALSVILPPGVTVDFHPNNDVTQPIKSMTIGVDSYGVPCECTNALITF